MYRENNVKIETLKEITDSQVAAIHGKFVKTESSDYRSCAVSGYGLMLSYMGLYTSYQVKGIATDFLDIVHLLFSRSKLSR